MLQTNDRVAEYHPKLKIQEYKGYYFEFKDMDNDNMFSSGDRLHFWGKILNNCTVVFSIVGYAGSIDNMS